MKVYSNTPTQIYPLHFTGEYYFCYFFLYYDIRWHLLNTSKFKYTNVIEIWIGINSKNVFVRYNRHNIYILYFLFILIRIQKVFRKKSTPFWKVFCQFRIHDDRWHWQSHLNFYQYKRKNSPNLRNSSDSGICN